jgi:hypothetical protein
MVKIGIFCPIFQRKKAECLEIPIFFTLFSLIANKGIQIMRKKGRKDLLNDFYNKIWQIYTLKVIMILLDSSDTWRTNGRPKYVTNYVTSFTDT